MAAAALISGVVGGPLFVLFWLAAALAVAFEWQRLIGRAALAPRVALAAFGVVAAGAAWLAGQPALGLGVGIAALAAGFAHRPTLLWNVSGVIYAAALAAGVLVIRLSADDGLLAFLWLFAVVWPTDVGAYFAGRALGGPKLWPAISPRKTWSGLIGGVLAAAAASLLVLTLGNVAVRPQHLLLAVALALASQAGDFLESWVKRCFGAKDTGGLIPGHGGVMDRLDGFIAAVVLAALIGLVRGGPDAVATGLIRW